MSTAINKQMVELYILGVLPDEARRRVEDAFGAHPVVQEWFVELGELPDHVLEAEEDEFWMDAMQELRLATISAEDRQILELAEQLADADDADDDITLPPTWTGASVQMDFPLALPGAPKTGPRYALATTPQERFGQAGNFVYLECAMDDIPHGICRLRLTEEDGTVTQFYPQLEFGGDMWTFDASIQEILGRAPTSQCVRVDVVPAGAHNRSEFMTEHVRAVISDWLEGTEQRRRAENFLAQGEPDE